MSKVALYRWDGAELVAIDGDDYEDHTLEVADSFLVSEGRAFALELHRDRFFAAVRGQKIDDSVLEETLANFWNAALLLVPSQGHWFPRLELRSRNGTSSLLIRNRVAPKLKRSATVTTLAAPDPRRVPEIKGPDLEALVAARAEARQRHADDAVILTSDGYVIDGTTSALVWWRGDILCAPPAGAEAPEFARVDSVSARSLLGLATALGVEVHRERVTPSELEGTEVWALNALHGIRIVTEWLTGPRLAELPGRLGLWQQRRNALVKPIGVFAS